MSRKKLKIIHTFYITILFTKLTRMHSLNSYIPSDILSKWTGMHVGRMMNLMTNFFNMHSIRFDKLEIKCSAHTQKLLKLQKTRNRHSIVFCTKNQYYIHDPLQASYLKIIFGFQRNHHRLSPFGPVFVAVLIAIFARKRIFLVRTLVIESSCHNCHK